MKKLKITLVFLFLMSFPILGQERGVSCFIGCADNNNSIVSTNIINQYSANNNALNAQAYWWEVLNGGATIVGSNKNSTVNLSGNISNRGCLQLTWFKSGNCYTACTGYSIQTAPPNCNFTPVLTGKNTCNEPGGQTGGTANIKLDNSPAEIATISSVTWTFSSSNPQQGFSFNNNPGSNTITTTNASSKFNEPFTYTSHCSYGIQVDFEVVINFNNGCPPFSGTINVLLAERSPINKNSDSENSKFDSNITLTPNPLESEGNIYFSGIKHEKLKNIEVLDIHGYLKLSERPNKQYFNTSSLNKGIYIVRFTTINNEIIQKKLIIK